jgi:CBS domain containing-hemolysin-like protein
MADIGNMHPWLAAGLAVALVYRAAMAVLLESFHALPSLQRRRLLEEEAVQDPLLARLLEEPHAMGMGITLINQVLLVILVILLWPMQNLLPGGFWTLIGLTIAYVWVMDLALPTLLTAGEPWKWIVWLFPLYSPVHRMLSPLVAPLAKFVDRRVEAQDKVRVNDDESASDDAVTALLEEGEAEGILEEEDRELIRNVVGFGDTVVREVMTPRVSIQGIAVTASMEEVWEAFRGSRHSRLPVYSGTIDHILGVLLLKDLMQQQVEGPFDLLGLVKQPLFVPESKPTLELLRELQLARTQLAIAVDEFGSVSGVVTVEDLLEEVFGEIQEEHEAGEDIHSLPDGNLLVSGTVHIEDLEERLGVTWERSGFDTLAGLLMARLGRVPILHESLVLEGIRMNVQKMDGARVLQVLVSREVQ